MSQDSKNTSDFGAIFEAHLAQLKTGFQIGDRVRGTVTAIDRNNIFVDVGSRSDALIDRVELVDAQGNPTVHVGDAIEAFCVGTNDDTVRLTTRMSGTVADASLQEAYESGIPVEGRVAGERKGGRGPVALARGFCPYRRSTCIGAMRPYIGEKLTFSSRV